MLLRPSLRLRLCLRPCSLRSPTHRVAASCKPRISAAFPLLLPHMSTRSCPSPEVDQLRSAKRRKIEIPADFQSSLTKMATNNDQPPTLELTEVETTLRQLLLDVAEYIETSSPSSTPDPEVKVPDELSKAKMELRFTGGWVRDKLLGVPSHDIDVAINNMTGLQFGLKMRDYLDIPGNPEKYGLEPAPSSSDEDGAASKGGRKVAGGHGLYKIEANPEKSKHLETVTTKILGIDLDLVNLRKETYSEDSRNPQMEFGTPEEDALRRDATVNAMFYNLNTSTIEDFTKRGFEDMRLKIIRTPLEPYQTFKDDPLRVLRLIRFASRLGYTIDPAAEQAMANPEIKEALKLKISRERVGIEIEKMLKGPDPYTALALIERLGLYTTVFTDPAKDYGFAPEMAHLKPSYDCVALILAANTLGPDSQPLDRADPASVIHALLIRNPEETHLAWLLSVLVPYADAPTVTPKPKAREHYLAELVTREGIKAPNKICEVITSSCRNFPEIQTLVDRFIDHTKNPKHRTPDSDATARDVLGMAIIRWGATWRSQALFSMLHEIVNNVESRPEILQKYARFLAHLSHLNLLEAYNFKPILNGTDIAKSLNTKPGPWVKECLSIVMTWQLLHPDVSDPSDALEALKPRILEEKEKSEAESKNASKPAKAKRAGELLRARLARHILSLIIRPLFAQAKRPNTITPNARQNTRETLPEKFQAISIRDEEASRPWKKSENSYALDLLRWVLLALDNKSLEDNWPLLVPPILTMIDEVEVPWKARGVEFLDLLLQATPTSLLAKTGLGDVFQDALMPCLSYLPTLTPEKDSITLLSAAYPALLTLCNVRYPPSLSSGTASTTQTSSVSSKKQLDPSALLRKREQFLDTLLRKGILKSYLHAFEYVGLSSCLLCHLRTILSAQGIASVKHLQETVPLVSSILAEPLGPSYPPLLLEAAKALQVLIGNAWPRIWRHRGDVLKGVCVCWVRLAEEGDREEFEGVKQELRIGVEMLVEAVEAAGEETEQEKVDIRAEFGGLVEANEKLKELLDLGPAGI